MEGATLAQARRMGIPLGRTQSTPRFLGLRWLYGPGPVRFPLLRYTSAQVRRMARVSGSADVVASVAADLPTLQPEQGLGALRLACVLSAVRAGRFDGLLCGGKEARKQGHRGEQS